MRSGLYTQQQFFIVLPALLFSAQGAGQLFSLSPEIARAKTAAASVHNLLSSQPIILQRPSASSKLQAPHLPKHFFKQVHNISIAKIQFDNVSFSYKTQVEQQALDSVSFAIKHGQTVALVGPSGAGKSSVLALIERFFDPTQGQILFEGTNLTAMDVQDLRQRISIVPQDPELFPGTVTYNIGVGAVSGQHITQDAVEEVAKQCGLHEFISSLPDGYNTECGPMTNSRFSGGQRQRLSLARALIRNCEILILDEPTSALDATSEQVIQSALRRTAKGRTTIIVAHRLASIRGADRIVVFDNGRVVEQGTHTELLRVGGLYATMAKAQSLA